MKVLLLFSIGMIAAVAVAIPAFGARSEKPSLSVSMTTASAVGPTGTSTSSVTLSGCGYSKPTTIIVWHDGTGPYQEVTPDANGCVSASFAPFGPAPSGDYIGQSWQMQGNHWDKAAEVSFAVS